MLVDLRAILAAAQAGRYAVGAFNVYNLEGARAVVAAAEAARSPAILQVHPGALRDGGATLLHLCLAAARAASASPKRYRATTRRQPSASSASRRR